MDSLFYTAKARKRKHPYERKEVEGMFSYCVSSEYEMRSLTLMHRRLAEQVSAAPPHPQAAGRAGRA